MSEFERKWEAIKAENARGDYTNGEAWVAGNGMKMISKTNWRKYGREEQCATS